MSLFQIDMLVLLRRRNKIMKRHSKKLVKLMESYLMLNKNLVMMLVKTLIIQPPVHPIHQMEVSVSPWTQRKCLKPFSETEMELECIMRFIITLALEVIMRATCQAELSSSLHRNYTYLLTA